MHWIMIFQLTQALASVATVVLVILAWQQLRLLGKQATTTFEDGLTEQYRKITEDIPIDIWMGSGLNVLDEEQLERCRHAIYRYIDLSNEQAFLHDKKRVTDEIWIEWKDGIKGNMKLIAFDEVWAQVKEGCPHGDRQLRQNRV